MQPLRSADVRQLNERVVLNLFYDYEKVSQSQIASLTGLKPSTVLRIFANLESNGEIYMIDPEAEKVKRSSVGRHPVYYRINPSAHYSIGLTFAKDVIELVIVDFALNIVHSVREPFSFSAQIDSLPANIATFVQQALADAGVQLSSVLGMGVGCPGNVDPDRGLLLSIPAEPYLHDYPLKEKLEALLGVPMFLQGSNLLAAQYYNRYGDIESRSRILYLSIGSAVTASFYMRTPGGMLDGVPSLLVGWMLLQRPDNILHMQNVLTLNDVCAEGNILSALKPYGISTMEELDNALENNSASLDFLIRNVSDALSFCISNLSMLFQPQAVIIASRSRRFSQLLASTSSHILDTRYYWPLDKEPLVLGKAHNFRKISRSAVDLVLDNEFNANLGWNRPKALGQSSHEEG